MSTIKIPKKLIDVAIPLEDINDASGKEKSIRHGHPSTIHPWWASRSLAAGRAILFAQLVNDPGRERGWYKGRTKEQADLERERLFNIIRELVKWENSNNETVINAARAEIQKSWKETCDLNGIESPIPLEFIDPFNGRGYLPLEAQRLGLITHSSDLNPVAVMNGKALLEIPRKQFNKKPVGPEEFATSSSDSLLEWSGASGLAEDIQRYAKFMSIKAQDRLSHLFPKYEVDGSFKGATVLTWLWTFTVPSPSPAANGEFVPLVSSFNISKANKKEAWVEPVVAGNQYHFKVHGGKIPADAMQSTKSGRGSFFCLISGAVIDGAYIKRMGVEGKLKQRMMAILIEKGGRRQFVPPSDYQEELALSYKHAWHPTEALSTHPQYMGPPRYGMTTYGDIFTERQLAVLDTFADLLPLVKQDITEKCDDEEYALAVCTYLGLSISKASEWWSKLTRWMSRGTVGNVFETHVMPMRWDFAEANPFSEFHCGWEELTKRVSKAVGNTYPDLPSGETIQADARNANYQNRVVSTDPPYYDNIPYADIADYFYVWQRRALKAFYPDLYGSIQTPKADELVADVKRHGSEANDYFMNGMTDVMSKIAIESSPYFPVTIYYAFKQSETNDVQTASRGWEAFLEAVLNSGFQITGTWPIRTERVARSRARDSNALASSIVLVCYRRDTKAETISRRQLQREIREHMDESLRAMLGGETGSSPIPPVDLAQSAIGPGMGIFSKYRAVLEADGSKMTVHSALGLINKEIDNYLSPESSGFDEDTQFCSSWFSQFGWAASDYGTADTLARAKGTSVDGVTSAGVAESGGGKVRLLRWESYPDDWDPKTDNRMPVWESCHHMIRALNKKGEDVAGALLARMPEKGEQIRQLAYHLYNLCERKKWAEDARAYNELIGSWHAIVAASHEVGHRGSQSELGLDF